MAFYCDLFHRNARSLSPGQCKSRKTLRAAFPGSSISYCAARRGSRFFRPPTRRGYRPYAPRRCFWRWKGRCEAACTAARRIGAVKAVEELVQLLRCQRRPADVHGGQQHAFFRFFQRKGDSRTLGGVFHHIVQQNRHQLPNRIFVAGKRQLRRNFQPERMPRSIRQSPGRTPPFPGRRR